MKKTILLFALLASASVSAQTVDPATQINWPRVTGSGAPTLSCTSGNYGQPYTDTADAPAAYYVCGATGWQKLSFAAEHNGTAFAVPGLANFLDTPTGGIPAGYQAVTPSVDSSSGIGFYTASTAGQVQQLPTGLPSTGQYVILYPQGGSDSGCGGSVTCDYGTGPGAWMQIHRSGSMFGDAFVTLTGTALPSGVSDANVTAVYGCATGYAMGYGVQKIPNTALSGTVKAYGTYCALVASGPGYDYADASWTSQTECSAGCSGNSSFSYAQPFLVVYYSGTPVTENFLSFAPPFNVQNETVGLQTAWPAVFDTGTANAYVSATPGITTLIAGQQVILDASHANTGASTFAFNGAGAAAIVKAGGAALAAGDITTNAPALLLYQPDGTWLDTNPQTSGGSGAVSSVSNSDGSLTVSPTTGAVVGSINYAHAGTWTALETFNAGISASALTLSGITGSTQCLHVSSSGVVSGTGADCGSGSGGLTVGTTPISGGTSGNGLYDNAGVLGEKAFAPALACTTVSSLSPANSGCYNLSASSSAAMPSASAFTIFKINTQSGVTATLTGTTLTADAGCSSYISGTTLALTGNQSITVQSDGTNIWATCTAASSSLPSGATNQLLYYAAPGTTATPLTLGTNLSIASGTLNASGGAGANGTVTYTSSQTASSSDNGKLVVMNCSAACVYTLPATQPTATWQIAISTQGSVNATLALGGSDTFNGSSGVPDLISQTVLLVWANSAVSTDYRGGASVNTIWNGSGAPSVSTGNNGDFYVDTAAACLYGPKASNVWPGSCTSLVGPSWFGGTITPVVTANWSAIGSGCSTTNTTSAGGGAAIQVVSSSGAQNVCGVKTAVSGNFSHVFIFYNAIPGTTAAQFASVEIGFTDGTKVEYCGMGNGTNPYGPSVTTAKLTALSGGTLTAPNGVTGYSTSFLNGSGPHFFRLRDTSGVLACDLSPDGVNWVNIFNDTAPFLTPTSIFFGADPRASTATAAGIFASYN